MAVTINDVAKRAGVSHTTVSWVIHDDPRITAKTKEKVWAAIEELDYHPNITARNLVRGKSNTIAVVAAFFSTFFEISILKGMELSEDEELNSYQINLFSTRGSEERQEIILKEILYGRRADGVILLSLGISDDLRMKFQKEKIPLLLVEEDAPDTHVIKMDNLDGSRTAVQQILKRGKKNIALVVGLQDPAGGSSAIERMQGYQEVLQEHQLSLKPERIYYTDNYYVEEGEKAYRKLMDRDRSIDAIFCAAGDEVALGILRAALREGRNIPQDLAIVGYDDIPAASLVHPSLCTMKQPIAEMGLMALKTLVESIKNPEKPLTRKVLSAQFVPRESC